MPTTGRATVLDETIRRTLYLDERHAYWRVSSQDRITTDMLRLAHTDGGQGVLAIADRDIAKGETILNEIPILVAWHRLPNCGGKAQITARFASISHKADFAMMFGEMFRLHGQIPGDLSSIFFTNVFHVQDGERHLDGTWENIDRQERSALYPTLARLNHSCSPNADCESSGEAQSYSMKLVATRNIRRDHEITISYLDKTKQYASVRARQQSLTDGYGFQCTCDLCRRSALNDESGGLRRSRRQFRGSRQ